MDAHGAPSELVATIGDLMVSLDKEGKFLNDVGSSLEYVSSQISKVGKALKEEMNACSAEIKTYYDDLFQLEEDLTANTYEGFIYASFMNMMTRQRCFYRMFGSPLIFSTQITWWLMVC